jgi:hypothetical protein
MTIYAKTDSGQQAAYDPQSELPRKLKSILKVIDGKTDDDIYIEKLQAFGDVRGMLHALTLAGLVQPVASGPRQVRSNDGISDADRSALMRPRSTDDWSATKIADIDSRFQSTQMRLGNDPDTVALPQASSLTAERRSARALDSAIQLMGSFVLTYMPEQSSHILNQLEDIASLEMLAVMFSGYEQMVSHLGERSAPHLEQVKQILHDNL